MFRRLALALALAGVLLGMAAPAQALPPGHEGNYYKFTIDDHQVIGQGLGGGLANSGKIEVSYLAHFREWPDGYIQPMSIKFYQHHHPIFKGGGWPFDIAWVKYHVTFTSDKVIAGTQAPRHTTLQMYPEYYDQKFDLSAVINGYNKRNNPRMCVTVQFDIAYSPDVNESMGCHRLTNWD